jgi:Mlc titration factor MtfA (ptsG expression regulator)
MFLFFSFLGFIVFFYFVVDKNLAKGNHIDKSEVKNHITFYDKTFNFFNLLNEKEKRKFVKRVIQIRKRKHFKISPEINTDHKEVELLVCAAFAQITFGFRDYHLDSFEGIIILPGAFYSRLAENNVKGLTVGSGFIYFSWEDFVKGYIHDEDKINLAIHEMAHALYIDRFHITQNFKWFNWERTANAVFKEIREELNHIYFRKYALHNINEFWAVCIEYFFEDPVNFELEYIELYEATASLLNQDMSRRKAIFENPK